MLQRLPPVLWASRNNKFDCTYNRRNGYTMKIYVLKAYFFLKRFAIHVWYLFCRFAFVVRSVGVVKNQHYADLMECSLPVWYHDFSLLGVVTRYIPLNGYRAAQTLKDAIIDDYLKIILQNKVCDTCNGFELFCSDGYYSHFFAKHGFHMLGVDLCEDSGEGVKRSNNLEHAFLVRRLLNNETMTDFRKGDVFDVRDAFDLVVNVGGLYHISNPLDLIEQNLNCLNSGGFLIVQSIVADVSDSGFFCSPAPGWGWGSRFSYNWLRGQLTKFEGIEILDDQLLDAKYNRSVYDRKYCSFLIRKL